MQRKNRSIGGTARWALLALICVVALAIAFQSGNRVIAADGDTVGDTRQVRLVYVQPAGETLTDEEQATGFAAVADALAFWERHTPATIARTTATDAVITSTVHLALASSTVITTSEDVYGSFTWARPWLVYENPDLTIFVVDNSATRRLFFGSTAGQALPYYGAVWVVLDGMPGPDGLPAIITHELGHTVYWLDDQPLGATDIMSWPASAYAQGFIGCRSLAALGAPCRSFYFPFMAVEQPAPLASRGDVPRKGPFA